MPKPVNVPLAAWVPAGPPPTNPGPFPEIAAFAFFMQKEGYRPATIQGAVKTLKAVARRTNLLSPEAVRDYLARADVSETRKSKICDDYAGFCKYKGLRWERPKYRVTEKLPFIPLESEVNSLISGVGRKTACLLTLLKETGMRIGEALDTKWTDIDLNRGIVNVTPEKHGHARQLKLSNNLSAMLNRLPRKWPLIFRNPKTQKENMIHTFRRHYINQRRRVADKLQNPRIEAITFHTMRHFYATMLYSKTRDLLLVKEKLGHRAIQNTLIYTHLVNFESDEYVSKVAKTVGEVQQLIEAGFDYVCDVGENKLFKKRK